MAASLALMLFVAITITKPREAEADWSVARIMESASDQLGQPAPPPSERISLDTLKERLASGDLPQLNIPATEGYILLDWDGLPVERWTLSNEAGELYHLYAIDGEELNPQPEIPTPVLKQEGGTALAAWTAKDTLYAIAHQGAIEALRPMLKTIGANIPPPRRGQIKPQRVSGPTRKRDRKPRFESPKVGVRCIEPFINRKTLRQYVSPSFPALKSTKKTTSSPVI